MREREKERERERERENLLSLKQFKNYIYFDMKNTKLTFTSSVT